MRAPVYSCVRLGAHAVEPHRNHHASCSDVPSNGITESRTYSNDNLLTAINYSNASLGNLTYTWDVNKNKKSESIGGVMSGYGFTNAGTTYDDEDRLTGYQRTNGALSQSWNLTSVGDWNSVTTNGTAQSRTHGPTHELLTAGGQTVNTDVKGNITLLPSALSSLASTALGMSWDFDNKLKSVDVGNNSSTDVEYKYDALGRRVARVGSSGSFVYVQSDQQTIADYGVGDAPSSPLYRYVYASYIDEPVVRKGTGTGGTIHYYHRNQQYSITAVTTSAGTVAERYAYSAYGEPTILDGSGSTIVSSSINNRYSYTGRERDATVGLYHFRARWMSPKTGRFLGRDPIGYAYREYLRYEYARARALIGSDPTGMMGQIVGGALVGCGVQGGITLVYSLINGDSFCNCACKSGVDCLFGALAGALATAFPNWSGCIIGIAGGLAAGVTGEACSMACDGKQGNVTCAVASALITGIIGCAVEAAVDDNTPGLSLLENTLWQVVSRLIGSDIAGLCDFFGPPGQPQVPGLACCTFQSGGTIWSESVNTNPGETSGQACARRADGILWDYHVVASREGSCS